MVASAVVTSTTAAERPRVARSRDFFGFIPGDITDNTDDLISMVHASREHPCARIRELIPG
jgi:hypothetical protein